MKQRSSKKVTPRRLVLTTYGSLGDLHPYLAVAQEWQRRGHHPVIATSEVYRAIVESDGIEFAPVRPDLPEADGRRIRKVMDWRTGPEYLLRRMVCPYVRDSYDDLFNASRGADAILGHPLTFAVPLVAHKLNIPWAYSALSPTVFLSGSDPPALYSDNLNRVLCKLPPQVVTFFINMAKRRMSAWFEPIRRLSREIGAFPLMNDPLGKDQFSPHLTIALFSSLFGGRQPDWPPQTTVAGFTFYEPKDEDTGFGKELSEFLSKGPPPIVFTLGSAAVWNAGTFYKTSIDAVQKLGMRAVLLTGRDTQNTPLESLPDSVAAFDYVPYSQLFPWCAAVVHQGGVGTTAQAMRAGRPMLIMPFAFDQPDNANRAVRLGVGRTISRENYNVDAVVAELKQLLGDVKYANSANALGRVIRLENGAAVACDAIEYRLLQQSNRQI